MLKSCVKHAGGCKRRIIVELHFDPYSRTRIGLSCLKRPYATVEWDWKYNDSFETVWDWDMVKAAGRADFAVFPI